MRDSIKQIKDATPFDDISGLKLDKDRVWSLEEIYNEEAKNIAKATIKYLVKPPSKTVAPFSYEWFQELHYEMFGVVWSWAGKFRQTELSIGIKAYLVPERMKNLSDDIEFWHKNRTYDTCEISARIHHKAVYVHPFQNGNGRFSRMLANIYLRQNGYTPINWMEDFISKENSLRDRYIKALKKADQGDYADFIELHRSKV